MSINLRHNLIKLVYRNPELRPDLLPLILKHSAEENAPGFEEVIKDYETTHPETGNLVKMVTLRNAPKGSPARNLFDTFKKDFESQNKSNEGDKKKEAPAKEKLTDAQKDKKNKTIKDRINGVKEKAKDKFIKQFNKSKKELKEGFDALSDTENKDQPRGFDMIVESMAILSMIFFDSSQGLKLLEDMATEIKAMDVTQVKDAVAEIKGAELVAIVDEEYREKLLDATGVSLDTPHLNPEIIKEWVKSIQEGEEPTPYQPAIKAQPAVPASPGWEGVDIPPEVLEEVLSMFSEINEASLRFLASFVDENGELDLLDLRAVFAEGFDKKDYMSEEDLKKEPEKSDGKTPPKSDGEGQKKKVPDKGNYKNKPFVLEKDTPESEKEIQNRNKNSSVHDNAKLRFKLVTLALKKPELREILLPLVVEY